MPWVHRSDRMSLAPATPGGDAPQLQTIDYTGLWKVSLVLYANSPDAFIMDGLPAAAYSSGAFAVGGEALPSKVIFGGAMLDNRPVLMAGKLNVRIAQPAQILCLIIREWITWEE